MSRRKRAVPHYSYTSEAYELNGAYEKSRRKRIRLVRRKLRPLYHYVGENKVRFSMYTVFTMVLTFLCAMALAFSFAFISNKQNAIASLRATLANLEEENILLAAEITQKYDLDEIRYAATTRLNMIAPKPHQIIYIEVPRPSFVMQQPGVDHIHIQEKTLLEAIRDFFSRGAA